MTGGKSKNKAKSATVTPAHHQEVEYEEEGGETDVEDQEDEEVRKSRPCHGMDSYR